MVTPIIVGLGAVTAALVGRHLVRNAGVVGKRRQTMGQGSSRGFKAKMAIARKGQLPFSVSNMYVHVFSFALSLLVNKLHTLC